MHRSYFTFTASNHYDLGFQMGQKLATQAQQSVLGAHADPEWRQRVMTARQMLKVSEPHFPNYIDEMTGYADGAQVPFEELWTLALEDDAFASRPRNPGKCTNLITNHGQLIGHNEDHDPHAQDSVCLIKKTLPGLTTLEIFYYNTIGGTSIGVSSHGYVHAINTLFYTRKQLGIPKALQGRFLLDSPNPEAAFDRLEQLPRASGYNHNIVDRSGRILNVECTMSSLVRTYPTAPFAHSNHCLIGRSGDSLRNSFGTTTRLRRAQQLMKPQMTESQLQAVLDDSTQGEFLSLKNERTVAQVIVNLSEATWAIWLRDEAEAGWVKYPVVV